MTSHRPKDALLDLLEEPLARAGLDLEGVEVASAGRRSLVRVLVDSDGGVTLDEVADATRLVSELLDGSEALGESPYTLEVTSPGVDRPLTLPRHWQRNVDRLVTVTPVEGSVFTGRLLAASSSHATLDVDDEHRDVPYADVAKARVEIEFNRPRAESASTEKVEEG